MALRFKIIHLLAVVLIVAVCCALCMSRSQAIARFKGLEEELSAAVINSKEEFREVDPAAFEKIKDMNFSVIGWGEDLRPDFWASSRRYQFEITDPNYEVYLYSKLGSFGLSNPLESEIEYFGELEDEPYHDIAKFIQFILVSKLGHRDTKLVLMEP